MVKSVKLADIAAEFNVSIVTVSKALSGQKGVSEELRQKIKEAAEEMGYTPVHSTQKSRSKSYTIGVISLENYFTQFASFYWKMYQEVTKTAVKKNCFTMLEVISHYMEESLEPPKLLEEQRTDGIIVIGRPKQSYLNLLYQYNKIPMVFMDFYDEVVKCDSVVSSSFYGAYEMTHYLITMGHKKIGYVGTIGYTESITDRYFGYSKALMEAGIEERKDWIIEDRDKMEGTIGIQYEFKLPEELPTAFVCNNDVSAYALISQLEEKGYRVPEDISVVGYDDYLYPEFGDSKITTYAVDMGEMSSIALRCLVKKIENSSDNVNIHIVSGKMVIRDSVKRLEE